MTVKPITKAVAIQIADWRNVSREVLRTGWTTVPQQEAFYENNFREDYMYWQFDESVTVGEGDESRSGIATLAAGGFVNIEEGWRDYTGEIALIVNPMARSRGFGTQCVEWLLHEGFGNIGFDVIRGEVYECGAVAFWKKFIKKYNARTWREGDRKYWDFQWYGSLFFRINWGEYERIKKEDVLPLSSDRDSNRDNEPISPGSRIRTLDSSGA